jgi:thiosulfate/3-mercaptopyruvate sulfurtransferase
MSYETLVETTTLATRLGDPFWVTVDCRFALADPSWGAREYLAGHIPGAVYAHLESDLSGPVSGRNGRHPLPDPAALARTLGVFGIAKGTQVVAFDQDNGMFASRLWWLLKWMGHQDVAVLDGGFARWLAEGRPTRPGGETRQAKTFSGRPNPRMIVDAADVEHLRTTGRTRLIDVRAPERYRGDVEPIDRVPGHIPGAVNDHFMQNVDEGGVFRSPAILRARLSSALGGARPDEAVCYCGSGVTACHTLLALELAGLRGARLYPGSWSEWSSDPSRPIETARDSVQEKGPAM